MKTKWILFQLFGSAAHILKELDHIDNLKIINSFGNFFFQNNKSNEMIVLRLL